MPDAGLETRDLGLLLFLQCQPCHVIRLISGSVFLREMGNHQLSLYCIVKSSVCDWEKSYYYFLNAPHLLGCKEAVITQSWVFEEIYYYYFQKITLLSMKTFSLYFPKRSIHQGLGLEYSYFLTKKRASY
jgi:hypothetical protein